MSAKSNGSRQRLLYELAAKYNLNLGHRGTTIYTNKRSNRKWMARQWCESGAKNHLHSLNSASARPISISRQV